MFYYMEESVLLGTKPLVDSIRHFIRNPSGVFPVCHLCECRIVQWRHDSRLLLLLNWFLASRLFSLVARTISHSFAALTREILFLPLEHNIPISSRHRVISSMYVFGRRVAMCCDMLDVVGSSLKMVKFEPTTPNTSQHGGPKTQVTDHCFTNTGTTLTPS